MRVSEIRLHNWGPFYGDHCILLKEGVYAVLAQREDDPQRSNWVGKSWFIGAIRFALFGSHLAQTEDGWISHDESKGSVHIRFSDGSEIVRSRKRGSGTQLAFTQPGCKVANQKLAQDAIHQHFGFEEADFLMSCFFEQKQIGRIIRARPAERTEIVNGWLELGKLQDVEGNVRTDLVKLSEGIARVEMVNANRKEHLRKLADTELLPAVDAEAIAVECNHLRADLAVHEGLESATKDVEEYDQMLIDGRAIRKRIDQRGDTKAQLAAQREKVLEASNEHHEAKRLASQIGNLLSGDFDGKCPVTCADCPVADTVHAIGAKSESRYERAKKAEKAAYESFKSIKELADLFSKELYADQSDREKLKAMGPRAKELKASRTLVAGRGKHHPDEHARVGQLLEERLIDLGQAQATAKQAKSTESEQDELSKMIEADQERIAISKGELETIREALAVVGRGGVQRDIAAGALTQMEEGANRLLTECSIDLAVKVSWAKEGKGLAVHCDQCGSAYPSSQKVKDCPKCSAVRGPKLVEKLELTLSDFSGAAEDLAGVAFQLSAAHWLRQRRSADLAVAVIDEAFGALDERNRKRLSSHLSSMLRGRYGFEQAFLVSHDFDTMDAMPNRIMITGSQSGSTVEVL